ncbi:MAG: hypothetical protein AAF193_08170, partial [Bacteroidota bacterium]
VRMNLARDSLSENDAAIWSVSPKFRNVKSDCGWTKVTEGGSVSPSFLHPNSSATIISMSHLFIPLKY